MSATAAGRRGAGPVDAPTFVLPASGLAVRPRVPDGHDELMLAEGQDAGVGVRAAVVRRLAPLVSGDAEWDEVPYVDVDAALLGIRRLVAGDTIVAEIRCGACQAWGDVRFSIDEFLAARRRRSRSVAPAVTAPSVRQVLAAVAAHGVSREAAARLEADSLGALPLAARRQAVRALEHGASPLAGRVEGICPECGDAVDAWFDPGWLVLCELRTRAARVIEQVHTLAVHYGWSEAAILAIPGPRRAAYAALAGAGAR
jgi:hypothetical protein